MNGHSQQKVQISVQLSESDTIAAEDIDEMARLLRNEIETLPGTESVELKPSDSPPPARTKSVGEAVTLGAVLLTVLPIAIPPLIDYIKEWTLRPGNSPVKIKVQRAGETIVEVEFNPRVNSKDDVIAAVREIQALLEPQP